MFGRYRKQTLTLALSAALVLCLPAWAKQSKPSDPPEDVIYAPSGEIIYTPKNPKVPEALGTETTLSLTRKAIIDFKRDYGRAPLPNELKDIILKLPPAEPGSKRDLIDQAMNQAGAAARDALNRGETITPGSDIKPNTAIGQLVREAVTGQETSDIAYNAFQDSLTQIQNGDMDSCYKALETLNNMRQFFSDAESGKKAAEGLNVRCGKDFAPAS